MTDRNVIMTRRSSLILGALLLSIVPMVGQAEEPAATAVAFLGLTFINTSLEPVSEAEEARLALTADRLGEGLEASGRYRLVDTAPVAAAADRYDNLAHCNGCDTGFARDLGAEIAVTGEVQKTSNLILHISVYMRDAETGALVNGGSVDIRSNTDKSWLRGIDYILKNRILRE
ncbi:MAG: DUF3280 domain-containing protein [Pseudomonadota bacterium]